VRQGGLADSSGKEDDSSACARAYRAELPVELDDTRVLGRGPLTLCDVGPQLVHPALAALLLVTAQKRGRDLSPVVRAADCRGVADGQTRVSGGAQRSVQGCCLPATASRRSWSSSDVQRCLIARPRTGIIIRPPSAAPVGEKPK
jgi:hypothetical protein